MQKNVCNSGSFFYFVSILLISDLVMVFEGCRNTKGETIKENPDGNTEQQIVSDVNPAYVRFSSFQNPDSTWGYTIFVNSRPYLRVTRTPFEKSGPGFRSKGDAEIVAGLIVKMIKNGDLTPTFDKKLLDSLEMIMTINKDKGR
jgi:hypothetical protein